MEDVNITKTDELRPVYEQEVVNPNTQDWIVCDRLPDVDALAHSALNVSWILDAPSGKHGFLQRDGDSFRFADGTRARLWGANVVAKANFLDREDADKLVGRITAAGFNLVRFHHMDASWVKPNIFGVGKGTRNIDEESILRFEYLWSELKKRGVYFMVDPLCSRIATKELDGIDSNAGFKASAVFVPELKELQKEYARQLFQHVNPYTGMCMKEDPSLVFVDIINEDSLLWANAAAWAMGEDVEIYDRFNRLFTDWLKKRYASTAELAEKWSAPGKEGLLAEEGLDTLVRVPLDFNTEGLKRLSAEKQSDIRRFCTGLHQKYYEEMLMFYREEIGLHCMIAGSNAPTYPDILDLYSNTACGADFLDQHAYYGGTAWGRFWLEDNLKVFTIAESSFSEINRTILDTFQERRVRGFPYLQSEWNQVEPNFYSSECLPLLSAYGALFGWNPVFFAFLQEGIPTKAQMQMCFDIYEIPTKSAVAPICSLIFHRGDVLEATDGYYVPVTVEEAVRCRDFENPIPRDMKRFTRTGLCFKDGQEGMAEQEEQNTRLLAALKRNSAGGVIKSITGQLTWHNGLGFTLDTPYSCGQIGFVGRFDFATEFASFEMYNRHAAVLLASLSGKRLTEADHLLLTAAAGWRMVGETFSEDARTLLHAGDPPMMVEPVEGKILLKTEAEYEVYCLDFSGSRRMAAPVRRIPEGLEIILTKENKALNYELIRRTAC